MATHIKFNAFKLALAHGTHNLGSHQLVVALCNAANAPDASSDALLANLTQISYTNLSSRNITRISSSQTDGTYRLILQDLTLTASGGSVGPFRYVVVYNDTATSDPLIAFYDAGSDVTIANGQDYLVDFDGANGLLSLT